MYIDLHRIDASSSSFSSPHRMSSLDMLGGTAYDEMVRYYLKLSLLGSMRTRNSKTHLLQRIFDVEHDGMVARTPEAYGQREPARVRANDDEADFE